MRPACGRETVPGTGTCTTKCSTPACIRRSRFASRTLQHCVGPNWKADGWITVGGVSTPIELDITYRGLLSQGAAARFSARITIDVYAEAARASIDLQSWIERSRQRLGMADAV